MTPSINLKLKAFRNVASRSCLVVALCLVAAMCLASSTVDADDFDLNRYADEAQQWEEDIVRIEALNESESHPPESVLFIGSSSIRLWDAIAEDVAPYHPIRRGFGGAKISDVLIHLPRLIGDNEFRAIVFFVGGNDVWGQDDDKSPEEIRQCADALIEKIRADRPLVPIFFIEITPSPRRANLDESEQQLNAALKDACASADGVHFIATRAAFLDSQGQRTPRWFTDDELHLNAEGYDRWAGLIKTALDQVLESDERVFDPWEYHFRLAASAKPRMQFEDDTDFEVWHPQLQSELRDILAVPERTDGPLNASITFAESTDEYDMFRVVFQAEQHVDVPCFLLKPKNQLEPLPVMICLQGHKKEDGMLVSIGRVPDDGGRDIALQPVRNGWAALCVEQRCFGERLGDCQRESLDALMLGKTLTGERVFDVMRAIDFIETQPDLDSSRIGCMGNSTGGTVTFYAACVDTRIRLAVVSCSFCSYAESWLKIRHCACGYLPGILEVADMGDLGGLVAPRDLIIVAGKDDYLATLIGVQTAFAQTDRIYDEAQCPGDARLLVGESGHQFYPDLAWPEIQKTLAKWASAD